MHDSVMAYCREFGPALVAGKRVLEVGAADFNGTFRSAIDPLRPPAEYIGVDADQGVGVDRVCDATRIAETFGKESFDVVISTSMLEHARDWRAVITNIKEALKPGGAVLLTAASEGFPLHYFPDDFWRFSVHDMRQIFGDFDIVDLRSDPEAPGVFIIATKPKNWAPADLTVMFPGSTGTRR